MSMFVRVQVAVTGYAGKQSTANALHRLSRVTTEYLEYHSSLAAGRVPPEAGVGFGVGFGVDFGVGAGGPAVHGGLTSNRKAGPQASDSQGLAQTPSAQHESLMCTALKSIRSGWSRSNDALTWVQHSTA